MFHDNQIVLLIYTFLLLNISPGYKTPKCISIYMTLSNGPTLPNHRTLKYIFICMSLVITNSLLRTQNIRSNVYLSPIFVLLPKI